MRPGERRIIRIVMYMYNVYVQLYMYLQLILPYFLSFPLPFPHSSSSFPPFHLPQARNLVYMIQRRERLKSLSVRTDHDITGLQLKELEAEVPVIRKPGGSMVRGVLCLKR